MSLVYDLPIFERPLGSSFGSFGLGKRGTLLKRGTLKGTLKKGTLKEGTLFERGTL
jgi:hypothetical protein